MSVYRFLSNAPRALKRALLPDATAGELKALSYTASTTITIVRTESKIINYTISVASITPPAGTTLGKIIVTAQYLDYDGVPKTGSVVFIPDTVLIDQYYKLIYTPKTYTANLDINGVINIQLPASDDPDLVPADIMRYRVQENLMDGSGRIMSNIKIPYSAISTGYDLSLITSWN